MILKPQRLFDGAAIREGMAVVVTEGRIDAVVAAEEVPGGTALPGLLAPGFIDLQVNGSAGRMVDGTTDVEALRAICAAQARHCIHNCSYLSNSL